MNLEAMRQLLLQFHSKISEISYAQSQILIAVCRFAIVRTSDICFMLEIRLTSPVSYFAKTIHHYDHDHHQSNAFANMLKEHHNKASLFKVLVKEGLAFIISCNFHQEGFFQRYCMRFYKIFFAPIERALKAGCRLGWPNNF